MNKPFKTVRELIPPETRIYLAGIAFTLFSVTSSYSQPNANFEKVDGIVVEKSEVTTSPDSDVKIELSFNASETSRKMNDAFFKFCKIEPQADKLLSDSFCEIREGLGDIMINKISIDGVPDKGSINVGMLLPDGAVLSVNKRKGVHPDGFVGFNIIHNRELLVSDVLEISDLQKYILRIQKPSTSSIDE